MYQWLSGKSQRSGHWLLGCVLLGPIIPSYMGILFHIDTGNHPPILFQPSRYGMQNSKVMLKLVVLLDENSLVEEDDKQWGSLVVIANKPHQ